MSGNINYETDFAAYEKNKKLTSKFLSLEDNVPVKLTLKSLEQIKAMNNFSHEMEDTILYKFTLMLDGQVYEKQWTNGSLAIFNQFKEQSIQPGDKVEIVKQVVGKEKNTLVKKLGDVEQAF